MFGKMTGRRSDLVNWGQIDWREWIQDSGYKNLAGYQPACRNFSEGGMPGKLIWWLRKAEIGENGCKTDQWVFLTRKQTNRCCRELSLD